MNMTNLSQGLDASELTWTGSRSANDTPTSAGVWYRLRHWWRLQWQLFCERVIFRSAIDRVYLVGGGHIFFQTLAAALRFDLITMLEQSGPLTNQEIAKRLAISEYGARILLLGCVSMQLLKCRGGRYRPSFVARRLFSKASPANIIPMVAWQDEINYRPMARFHESLLANTNVGLREFETDGTTLYQILSSKPHLEGVFQDAMQSISRRANHFMVRHVNLKRSRCVMDIGGGNGSNLEAILRVHPRLSGMLFDLPTVCKLAEARLTSIGWGGRIRAVPGDCFQDPLPKGADTILLAHFCTIWSPEKNLELFKKCFEYLPSGGKLIVFNMMQNDAKDGPLSAAVGSPYFLTLATGGGMLYTWSEYIEWLKTAGFRQVSRKRLPMDHGLLEATK